MFPDAVSNAGAICRWTGETLVHTDNEARLPADSFVDGDLASGADFRGIIRETSQFRLTLSEFAPSSPALDSRSGDNRNLPWWREGIEWLGDSIISGTMG